MLEGALDQSSAAPQPDCCEQCPFPPANCSSLEATLMVKKVQELELDNSHSCPPSQLCVPSQFVSQINSPAVSSFPCADLLSSSLSFDGSFSYLVASCTSAVTTGKQLASFSKNARVANNSVAFIVGFCWCLKI